MKAAIRWFAANPVAANLLMLVIVVGGATGVGSIKREVFPDFSVDIVTVSVVYPGAAPAEVEEGICVRVEEAVADLEGVRKLRSVASEGIGTTVIEVRPGEDARRVLDDVKSRVDAITTFPGEAERPRVEEILARSPVIAVSVSGAVGERALRAVAERIRDELTLLPEITQVSLANARPHEISISLSSQAMERHRLGFDAVANAIRRASLDLPGGSVESSGGEILLRATGQARTAAELEALTVLTRADGTRVSLGDIATVVDGFAETDQSARFDGEPAVTVLVYRVGAQSAMEVAAAVKGYVEEVVPSLPPGVKATTWQDSSSYLRGRLSLLLRNGAGGLVLVFVTLALFLRLGLAFWVTLGIPLSFLGTLWLMPSLDVSINMVSLFAFILVLGIVVDDAIVVGESIFRENRRRPGDGLRAAIDGTHRVAVPVTFAVLTTVVTFAPMLGVPGFVGRIWRVIPLVVMPTLLFSLVESQLVLPAHLRHLPPERDRGLQRAIAGALERFVDRAYRPTLEWCLRWRGLVLAAFLAVALVTGGLVRGGWLTFAFFPSVEGDYVLASLSMSPGVPVDTTSDAVARLERAALEVGAELGVLRHVGASVGEQPFGAASGGDVSSAFSGSHLGEVTVELVPAEERELSSDAFARAWRERVGSIPDVLELRFVSSDVSSGDGIDLELAGRDLEELDDLAGRLTARLAADPAVTGAYDSFQPGKRELRLELTAAGEALGLSRLDLARQVRQAFHGEEVQSVARGRDEVDVMLRYPEDERSSLAHLEDMRLRLPDGRAVPFSLAARATVDRGYATIRRVDRRRVVTVTAAVDATRGNANQIVAELERDVLPVLLAEHPEVRASFVGRQQDQREALDALARGYAMALLVMYALMAVPFRSYVQPVLVMSAIPFGIVGAVWAHLLLDMELSLLSLCGMIALTGVVVNDSLVLVEYTNRLRDEGMSAAAAVREAGAVRFRPILLTSLTTFAGLTPLLLERATQARFLVPMAVSLGFGVLFATGITLIGVPVAYSVLEDARAAVRRLTSA